MTVDASVIILTKEGGDNFPRLLEKVFGQKFGGGFEVIVIDSGSTDGTLDIAARYPVRLQQIPPVEFHHGRTRNLGAEMAEGRYAVYITQDALPADDGWLQKLLDNFTDTRAAMVVGRQIPWENAKPPEKFFYHYHFPDIKIVVESGAAGHCHDNIFISDVNAAYRKEILLKYRFDESIVMAEDKEIAARFIENGLAVVYEPDAAVYHSHNPGLKDLFDLHLDYGLANRQGAGRLPKSGGRAGGIARYLGAECRFLCSGGQCRWLPYAMIYETVKHAGLALGRAGVLKGPAARKMESSNE